MTEQNKKAKDGKRLYNDNYFNIHQWISRHYGKAYKCENIDCMHEFSKRYEWALINGMQHKRDINNYIQLCASCHRKYDFTEEIRQNISNAKKGIVAHNKGCDSRFTKECLICSKEYKTYNKKSACCSKVCAAINTKKTKKILQQVKEDIINYKN